MFFRLWFQQEQAMGSPTSNSEIPSQRARLCLEGLSIGDAFGQQFFYPGVLEACDPKHLPDPPCSSLRPSEFCERRI
jgi:hypothetical protein